MQFSVKEAAMTATKKGKAKRKVLAKKKPLPPAAAKKAKKHKKVKKVNAKKLAADAAKKAVAAAEAKAKADREAAAKKAAAARKKMAEKMAKQQKELADKMAKKMKKQAAEQKAAAEKTQKLLAKLMKQVKKNAKKAKKAKKSKDGKKAKKQLKAARAAQLKSEDEAFKLRRELQHVKRSQADRLREERRKCAGKCDREFPILVGPKNVPATETRSVVVIGDRAANKKRWSRVDTHKRLFWHPKGLKKTARHITRAGRKIAAAHAKTKRISEAPLVEKW